MQPEPRKHPQGRRTLPLVAVLLCFLLGPFGVATSDEAAQRYRVEVIVFARAVPANPHYRRTDEPDVTGAIEPIAEIEPGSPEAPVPVIVTEIPFQSVALQSAARLAERIELLPEYDLLASAAWLQEAEVFGDARRIRLHGDRVIGPILPVSRRVEFFGDVSVAEEPIYQLDGTVTFERGRFPHLGLDLVYRRTRGANGEAPGALLRAGSGALTDPAWESYRISQRQRITIGQPQYFDHAQFGALAIVTALPAPADSAPRTP